MADKQTDERENEDYLWKKTPIQLFVGATEKF